MSSPEITAESFAEAERDNLRRWIGLSGDQKIDFFEEMVELAYGSGALDPERLAFRDSMPKDGSTRG